MLTDCCCEGDDDCTDFDYCIPPDMEDLLNGAESLPPALDLTISLASGLPQSRFIPFINGMTHRLCLDARPGFNPCAIYYRRKYCVPAEEGTDRGDLGCIFMQARFVRGDGTSQFIDATGYCGAVVDVFAGGKCWRVSGGAFTNTCVCCSIPGAPLPGVGCNSEFFPLGLCVAGSYDFEANNWSFSDCWLENNNDVSVVSISMNFVLQDDTCPPIEDFDPGADLACTDPWVAACECVLSWREHIPGSGMYTWCVDAYACADVANDCIHCQSPDRDGAFPGERIQVSCGPLASSLLQCNYIIGL